MAMSREWPNEWIVVISGLIGVSVLVCSPPCYAQGLNAADVAVTFKPLRLKRNLVSWQNSSDGAPIEITYKVMTKPQAFAAAYNCAAMRGFEDLLALSGISRSTLESELTAAFAMWEMAGNLKFHRVSTDEPAKILIGAQVNPIGWAFADVLFD